jgi:hypothetical protein
MRHGVQVLALRAREGLLQETVTVLPLEERDAVGSVEAPE